MAKSCIACGKNIGLLGVRIPLLGTDDLVICSDCFDKMPPVLNDLYQKRIFPTKSELLTIKNEVIQQLRISNYNQDTINVVTKYLDDKINEIQPRSMLKRNDILINIVVASIGRAAVYNCDEIANINQAVALVRVDYSRINQTYLMTYLNSAQAIEMYGKMKKGGARDNLSLQNIADLQIPVAPMELQNQFADFVEQTDKSKLAVQQSIAELEELKKSLMQKYFG